MTQKTVGYVELEWTCKRCGTVNPGTVKTCANCGAPMGEAEAFELPDQQVLITDKEKLDEAGKGPDLICPYCGTRNPSGTAACIQCGGDLKAAKAREQGQVLGAFDSSPAAQVPCPACGTPNPANAPRCQNCGAALGKKTPAPLPAVKPAAKPGLPWLWIGLAALGVLLCVGLGAILVMGGRTTATTATVSDVQWQRSIQVLGLRPVEHQGWDEEIPAEAQVGTCTERLRETRSEPVAGSVEVCGTPYTIDQGSGLGRVVQDCQYEVYDNWCGYQVEEWQVIDTSTQQGDNLSPIWPGLALQEDQREGNRSERYVITFVTNSEGKAYTYETSDPSEFLKYAPGSQWELEVNGFGSIVGVDQK